MVQHSICTTALFYSCVQRSVIYLLSVHASKNVMSRWSHLKLSYLTFYCQSVTQPVWILTVTVTLSEVLVLHSLLEDGGHITVSPYPGARRQNQREMFSVHDEMSPSIAVVSALPATCYMLAVQQHVHNTVMSSRLKCLMLCARLVNSLQMTRLLLLVVILKYVFYSTYILE